MLRGLFRFPRAHVTFFFFNDTATTEIYTLSLHDALPISPSRERAEPLRNSRGPAPGRERRRPIALCASRSEEHTSELQSQSNLVCRLLLEKKKIHTSLLLQSSSTVARVHRSEHTR